jgi:hypothetical protein
VLERLLEAFFAIQDLERSGDAVPGKEDPVSALIATSADWSPFQLLRYSARVTTRPWAEAPAMARACAVCSGVRLSAFEVPAATPYESWTVWSKPSSRTGASHTSLQNT